MNKRVGELEEFSFEPLSCIPKKSERELHVGIAITAWVTSDKNDILKPWSCLAISREQYALKYETKYLRELSEALNYLLSMMLSLATQEALKYTILNGLLTAIAGPATLMSMSSIIDNPWSVCCRRSSQVGIYLAHVLLGRHHGKRPITLIGYSLGARVIFYCLREMEKVGGKNAQGIIQDVVLLGAPVTANKLHWDKCAKVVAGRIINGYFENDWLLKYLYRTLSLSVGEGVAGMMSLEYTRIENINLKSIIGGHFEYSDKLDKIIKLLGLKVKPTQISDDININLTKSYQVIVILHSQNLIC